MPLVHVCAKVTHCKEVVIPDGNGDPIGALTCAKFCKNKAPPGYKPWKAPPGPWFGGVLPVELAFVDTDSGVEITLSKTDVEAIVAAAKQQGWV